jgi:hypothetical protein
MIAAWSKIAAVPSAWGTIGLGYAPPRKTGALRTLIDALRSAEKCGDAKAGGGLEQALREVTGQPLLNAE